MKSCCIFDVDYFRSKLLKWETFEYVDFTIGMRKATNRKSEQKLGKDHLCSIDCVLPVEILKKERYTV